MAGSPRLIWPLRLCARWAPNAQLTRSARGRRHERTFSGGDRGVDSHEVDEPRAVAMAVLDVEREGLIGPRGCASPVDYFANIDGTAQSVFVAVEHHLLLGDAFR